MRCFEEAAELHFLQQITKEFVVAIDVGEFTELRGTIEDYLDTIDEG